MLMLATVDEFKAIKELHNEGLLIIPPPDENIKSWPVIGPALYEQWTEISANILEFYKKHADTINPIGLKLIDLLSNAGMGILLLMGSFLVAGIMMVYGEQSSEYAKLFFARLAGKQGEAMESSVAFHWCNRQYSPANYDGSGITCSYACCIYGYNWRFYP